MEAQQQWSRPSEPSHVNAQQLPQFPSVPTGQFPSQYMASPIVDSPKSAMDIDNLVSREARPQRASSVTSGMSLEDLEAAETLEFLKHSTNSPRSDVGPPPRLVESRVEYTQGQEEPLLHLLTSQIPLLSSAVNNGMLAYSQTKSYSPVIRYPAEFLERNIGNPMAGTIGSVGRRTGVEGGLRWALQGSSKKRTMTTETGSPSNRDAMDIEKGISSPFNIESRPSQMGENLPAYDENGRSPPYQMEQQSEQEQQIALQHRQDQPPPGWQARLMISTSGLGVAMSEESRRSLKYCLSWLRWANARLAGVIDAVKKALEEWEERSSTDAESSRAVLTARILTLSRVITERIKQVVDVVSRFAGGALPQNARDIVHRHFSSLPSRFRYISMSTNADGQQGEADASSNANRVLALAQEGLSMMMQVSRVVDDTLSSAETWCNRLGRRSASDEQQPQLTDRDVKMGEAGDENREKSG